MKKYLILAMFSLFLLAGCEKDDIELTGNIELVCVNKQYIGVTYTVYSEAAYFAKSVNSYIVEGKLSSSTSIKDLNPGNYFISIFGDPFKTIYVQVKAGKTVKSNI